MMMNNSKTEFKYVGVDVEGASLDAKLDPSVEIYCVCFAWYENGDGQNEFRYISSADPFRIVEHIDDFIADGYTLVFHNAAFDVPVLRNMGCNIPIGSYVCTRLLCYCFDMSFPTSLEECSIEYLGEGKNDVHMALIEAGILDAKSKKAEVWAYDYNSDQKALNILTNYCKKDSELALRLWRYGQTNWLNVDVNLNSVYYNIELPYIECIIAMEGCGMYIDDISMKALQWVLTEKIDQLQIEIELEVGYLPTECKWSADQKKYIPLVKEYSKGVSNNKRNEVLYYPDGISSNPKLVYDNCPIKLGVNPESNVFAYYLMSRLKWKPNSVSKKTGEPTMNALILERLKEKYTIVDKTQELKSMKKLKGSFTENLLKRSSTGDGFVRCDFNQCTTITSRLSSSNPNLQQIPARTDLGKRIRKCVTSPEGYTLAVADLDQIELKVLAYYLAEYTGEMRMLEAIMNGEDLHQANADAWGLENRQLAKKIFSVIYGGSAVAVGKYGNNGTPQEGQRILDAMKNGMPAIWELMDMVFEDCRNNDGVVYTLFGTKLNYPNINAKVDWVRQRAERQVFNALIQGGSAGINKALANQVITILDEVGGRLAFAVHDENGAYIPDEEDVISYFLKEANVIYNDSKLLSSSAGWHVPVTGQWHVGKNWVEAKGG